MKLIRLTSETNDGRFDNDYNDEIILKPNSKIALQSVAVESDITELIIDGSNEAVEFEIKSGDTRSINLTHDSYDETNNHILVNELQLKLNQGLQYTDSQSATEFPSELGFQMKVEIGDKGKTTIDMANTRYTYTTTTLGEVFKENRSAQSINVTGTPMKVASLTATGVGRADSKHGISSITPFTTGCGIFRAKLSTWIDDSSGATSATSGFEFGLCDSKPSTWGLPDSMPESVKTFAIRAFQPTTAYHVKSTNAGAFTASAITPDTITGGDADILEISIQGANIVGNVFRTGEAAVDQLFSVPYEVVDGIPTPLYAYMIFHGARDKIEIIDLKFTPDAFLEPNLTDYELHEDVSASGVGARPIAARSRNTNKTIDFKSETLTSFLGFDDISNTLKGVNVTFFADELFTASIENDAMLIVLDNLPLESYDGFKKGRQSILASVPNPNSGSRIVYEPNNINYIELNNASTISLRNIRARILYQDYSPLKTKGFSVINILVNEN